LARPSQVSSDAPPWPEPFGAVLGDPGREPLAGARPVLALSPQDPPAAVAELRRRAQGSAHLVRRGRDHGEWLELPAGRSAELPRPSQLRQRFERARPWVWRGAVARELPLLRNQVHQSLLLHGRWSEPSALYPWLTARCGRRGARFAAEPDPPPWADPERDLARCRVRDLRRGYDDLWVKLARLSTFPGDHSLRLRCGFGREGVDDASSDEGRHRAVADLARELFPELEGVDPRGPLMRSLGERCGLALYPTQALAYWNAPQGGALFHHDAFAPSDLGGQRGVLYLQWAGRTAWLALSIADLARRVGEFLSESDDPAFAPLRALAADRHATQRELAQPGGGRLGPLIDAEPAFTAFLADSGHGAVLHPGDAIVIPNHGTDSTAMHSVFCASPGPTFALSLGLRVVPGSQPLPTGPRS
jgi:hypothetical protein